MAPSNGMSYRVVQLGKESRARPINPGYFFVAPAILFFAALAILPTLYVFYLSFFSSPRGQVTNRFFVGLQNYVDALSLSKLAPVVSHTLVFAIGSSLFHLLFGFLLALYLNSRLNFHFLNAVRALLLLPWAISPAVVSMVWRLLSHPQISPIGILLSGLNPEWVWTPLASTKTALLTLTGINVWHFTPFYMLMILAGLQAIDPTLYEVAKIDGASAFQEVWYVTIPQVRRLLFTLGLFDFVTTAVYFDLIWITTHGGPVGSSEVLATFVYRQAFLSFDFGRASAIAMLLFVVAITLSSIGVMVMERE
ncbi:MAG: ABC transporter permease subunit [Anaerolineae bacterium]|nr:ABC transporter permease subunit [Anaerolineae bacterium]NIN95574.1 ABC transporter permease subunit [Anaerolineae bacterium]NIQ79195.1 ABC transporter permease subunit [Anaerolineae bacterium]